MVVLLGAPAYNFVKISEKLHKIEKILVLGKGGGANLLKQFLLSETY